MGVFDFFGSLLGIGGSRPRQGIGISKHSANEGLPIILGRARVPAVKVFKTVSRNNIPRTVSNYDTLYDPLPTHGDEETKKSKAWLHRIDVWAQGPISAIERYYIDGEYHTIGRLGSRPYFRAIGYYGKSTQTAYTDLAAASNRWSAAHKGIDVAYSATRFFAKTKKPQFNGEPELDALVVGGAVYDPRLDSTVGGVGTQRFNDVATWAVNNNPALGLLFYMTHVSGRNLPIDEIDLPSFMAAADKFDAVVTIPPVLTNDTAAPIIGWWNRHDGAFEDIGVGFTFPNYRTAQVGTTQKRLNVNIALDPKAKVKENIGKLLKMMRADLPFSNGKFRLAVDDVVAGTVYDFDEDSIIGGLRIDTAGRGERINRMVVEFKNENKDFKEDTASWPALDSADYTALLAEDNGEALHQNITADGITDFYQAEDFAEYLVRKSRIGLRVTVKLSPVARLLEVGDVIGLTHSTPAWVNKWFIVDTLDLLADGDVTANLHEYDATVYTWSAKTNEPNNTPDDLPLVWAEPVAIAGFTVTAISQTKNDGTVISGYSLAWIEPTDVSEVEYIEIAWKLSADATFDSVNRLPADQTTAKVMGLVDGVNYDFRITYRNSLGVVSATTEDLNRLLPAIPTKLDGIEDGANNTLITIDDTGTPPAIPTNKHIYIDWSKEDLWIGDGVDWRQGPSNIASKNRYLSGETVEDLKPLDAGATVDSRYSNHNLAPYIASNEVNCGSYLFTVPATNLAAMGLQGGDVMAFSAWCNAEGTGTGVRPRLYFFDASLTAVGTFDPLDATGATVQATSGSTYEWVSGWNVTIPATATSVAMFAYRGSGTGGKMKWGKINRGPRPTPYDEPSLKIGFSELEYGATVDTRYPANNLIGAGDARPVRAYGVRYFNNTPIADLDLFVGDVLSARTLMTSTEPTNQGQRMRLVFLDASFVQISSHDSNIFNGASTDRVMDTTGITIPANTVYLSYYSILSAGTIGAVTTRLASLVQNTKPVPYNDPAPRIGRGETEYGATKGGFAEQNILKRTLGEYDLNSYGYTTEHIFYYAAGIYSPAESGKTITLSAEQRLYNDTVAGEWASVIITFYTSTGAWLTQLLLKQETSSAWTYAEKTYTIPSGAERATLQLYRGPSGSGTGSGGFRNIKLEMGGKATGYQRPIIGTDLYANNRTLEAMTPHLDTTGRFSSVHGMPANTIAGPSSAVNLAPISAADAGSTATITIAAHTRQFDSGAVVYNSGSITGKAFSTTYYIYTDDATLAGGARTYVATTNILDLTSIAGRVYLGRVTTPADGGGTVYQEPTSGGGEIP